MKVADHRRAIAVALLVFAALSPSTASPASGLSLGGEPTIAPDIGGGGAVATTSRASAVVPRARRIPDPVTFVPGAGAAGRAARPEALIGFGVRHLIDAPQPVRRSAAPDDASPGAGGAAEALTTFLFSGRMVSPEGAGLAGYIGLRTEAGDGAGSVYADADGNFSIALLPGSYFVQVGGPAGYVGGWYGPSGFAYNSGATSPIVVDAADVSVEIVMPHAVHISGRVTGGGAGLPGIEVDLFLDGSAYGHVNTANDGTYSIDAAPGAYLIGFYDPANLYAHGWYGVSGFTADPLAGKLVTVGPSDVGPINMGLPAARRIAGKVLDPFGHGLRYVFVEAWVNGVFYASHSTSSSGTFSLPVASGHVTLWVYELRAIYAPGWRTATGLTTNPAAAAVTIVGASNVSGIVIHELDASYITGLVMYAPSPGSLGSYRDTWIEADAYGTAASFATTDGYGQFTMPVLHGTYLAWADSHTIPGGTDLFGGGWYRATPGSTPDSALATPIKLKTGASVRIGLVLGLTRHVAGRIMDEHGINIPNVDVQLFVNGHFYEDRVAPYGDFSLPVQAGTYRLAFVDLYGTYRTGWLGAAGYVPDWGSALDVVIDPDTDAFGLAVRLPIDTPPAPPTGVAARPFHASAAVTWTAPPTSPTRPIIHYTVLASPGLRSCTATITGCTITGLDDGTAYTFTVSASTMVGTSVPSTPSSPVTPVPVPDAPTGVTAVTAGSGATVDWVAPADNGSPILAYTALATPGGATCAPDPADGTTCTIGGLADGRYTFMVVATNALGDSPTSAASATTTVDVTAPVVGAPMVTLRAGLSLTGLTVPVAVAWTRSDAWSGIAASDLELATGAGPFVPQVLSSPDAGFSGTLGAGSAAYRFRARATDGLGNVSGWTLGPPVTVGLHQETGKGITYKGTWLTSAPSSASGGHLRYTTHAGASVTYAFTGRAISWISRKGPTEGKASVYLDGHLVATVNLHATSVGARWVAWARTFTTAGKHTLKIVCAGTAGHARVDIDGFARLK